MNNPPLGAAATIMPVTDSGVCFLPSGVAEPFDFVLEARERAFNLVPIIQPRSQHMSIAFLERDPSVRQREDGEGSNMPPEFQRGLEHLFRHRSHTNEAARSVTMRK
jgi:hypothetical protein